MSADQRNGSRAAGDGTPAQEEAFLRVCAAVKRATHAVGDKVAFRNLVDEFMARNPILGPDALDALPQLDKDEGVRVGAFFALSMRLQMYAVQQSEVWSGLTSQTVLDDAKEKINDLLSSARGGLTYVLERYYDAPSGSFDEIWFFKCGTTSVLFADAGLDVLYKCVLPRYMQEPEIAQATAEYSRKLCRLRGDPALKTRLPRMYRTESDRYTTQEFIDGVTLEEYLDEHRATLHDDSRRELLQHTILELSAGLSEILVALTKAGEQHLDLSPSNIILRHRKRESETFERSDVCVVDLGRNFLLREGVGAYVGYQKAALYVADEVRRVPPEPDRTSDLFSIGFILLDVLTARGKQEPQTVMKRLFGAGARQVARQGRAGARVLKSLGVDLSEPSRLPPRGVEPDTWRDALDELWKQAPHFAAIIDDLVDKDPRRRLLSFPARDVSSPYAALATLVEQSVDVDKVFAEERLHRDVLDLSHLTRLMTSGLAIDGFIDVVRVRLKASEISEKLPDDVVHLEGTLFLPAVALLVSLGWLLVAASSLIFTFSDFGFGRGLANGIAGVFPHSFRAGAWRDNLPGRVTALTFSFIAARYYLNIFSQLSFAGIREHFSLLRRIVVRATGTVSPIFCLAGVLYPRYWPLFGAIGSVFIVANNFSMWRLAKRALKLTADDERSRGYDALTEFCDMYREWWVLFGLYGLGMWLLAGLILDGVQLHDQLVYAGVIVAINWVKVYRNNCKSAAPLVRGNLSRAIHVIRRMQRLADEDPRTRVTDDPSLLLVNRARPASGARISVVRSPLPDGVELLLAETAEEQLVIAVADGQGTLHPAAVADAARALGRLRPGKPVRAVFVDDERRWAQSEAVQELVAQGALAFGTVEEAPAPAAREPANSTAIIAQHAP